MPLSPALLRRLAGITTVQRGEAYFERGRVLSASQHGEPGRRHLRGTVRGSGDAVYEVEALVREDGDGVALDGNCTCPVAYNCKHVVAVCLALLAEEHGSGRAAPAAGEALSRWLQQVRAAAGRRTTPQGEESIAWVLSSTVMRGTVPRVGVEARVVKPRAGGEGLTRGRVVRVDSLRQGAAGLAAVTPADLDIANLLLAGNNLWQQPGFHGRAGHMALTLMLECGRCHWLDVDSPPLRAGPPRAIGLAWDAVDDEGTVALQVDLGGETLPVMTRPALYLDPLVGEVGALDLGGLEPTQLPLLFNPPAVAASEVEQVAQLMHERYADLPLPLPRTVSMRENAGATPRPRLELHCTSQPLAAWAALDFLYGSDRVLPLPPGAVSVVKRAGETVRVLRDPAAEQRALKRLQELGFVAANEPDLRGRPTRAVFALDDGERLQWSSAWARFLREQAPVLATEGWEIRFDPSFDLRFESAAIEAEVGEGDDGAHWFSVGFALRLGERRVPLAEILRALGHVDWSRLPETVAIPLGERHFVEVPSARLQPILDALRALHDGPRGDGSLRIARRDAALLTTLEDAGVTVNGGDHWRRLARQLGAFQGIAPVAPPAGLAAELRPYQQRGLEWLQFLRESGFNGVLADDMGLGKTLQTLAHLLLEREAGRLDRPALVVAPTSLVGNWRREAARFAPDLAVTVLHGDDRADRYAGARDADLLLTTYALLPRDAAALGAMAYHYVVLDEAQQVKNPRTKAAQVLRRLDSRYRLCLTGTPLENHLGELWALFDFLMPGFLGEQARFREIYRGPIERQRDAERRAALARRVAPFLLRRSKDQVATELPPKTEILQPVVFDDAQAELYESIRVSVDRELGELIARQGLARSQITVLDALTRLRQVCCDPRLLGARAGATAPPSAKLEFLLGLLGELLENGRRVLLFSQFTSMLALVEEALAAAGIAHLTLTGQTRDRDAVVERFRRGEAPVFLISLRAGGTGLNLPEADTVIHYDPWWNPAVEAQATDRAHRIGQTRPVFVYKLIVAGSVEEKMVELQARKRALANGLYADTSAQDGPALDDATLATLLAPIERDAVT